MIDSGKKAKSSKEIISALKAASDSTRIRIINILSFGAFNVNELVTILNMGQSRVSRHLKILTDAGLLESQREGTWVYYKLTENNSSSTDFAIDLNKLLISYKEDLPERESDQKIISKVLSDRDELSNKFFNKIGLEFDKLQEQVLSPNIYRTTLLSLLPDRIENILDMGCGPGTLAKDLLNISNSVVGIDSSPKMVEIATEAFKRENNATFMQANSENLPFEKESFDAVISSMVLHHISNPPLVLNEANRILKPEGTFCIVDLVKHDKEYMRDNYADLWLGFEPSLLTSWLENSGFTVEEVKQIETETVFKIITIKAKKKGGHYVHSNY